MKKICCAPRHVPNGKSATVSDKDFKECSRSYVVGEEDPNECHSQSVMHSRSLKVK